MHTLDGYNLAEIALGLILVIAALLEVREAEAAEEEPRSPVSRMLAARGRNR